MLKERLEKDVTNGILFKVLILILMEHAQRDLYTTDGKRISQQSLNPYFNGTCSKRRRIASGAFLTESLNPYFNGTCSKRPSSLKIKGFKLTVLILILMEHAQRDCKRNC